MVRLVARPNIDNPSHLLYNRAIMSAVIPRRKATEPVRPSHLPTAVEQRLNRRVLPSDTLEDWQVKRLERIGVDKDYLDTLTPDVVVVRADLPDEPIPETRVKTWKPST